MSVMYPLAIVNTTSVTSLASIKLYHHSISIYHTNIETNELVANLCGNGRITSAENFITQLVSDIPGARNLKNQMAVEDVKSK